MRIFVLLKDFENEVAVSVCFAGGRKHCWIVEIGLLDSAGGRDSDVVLHQICHEPEVIGGGLTIHSSNRDAVKGASDDRRIDESICTSKSGHFEGMDVGRVL